MNNQTFIDAIAEKYRDKVEAFPKQDVSFVSRFYSEEATAVAPGRDPLVGIEAVRSFYEGLLANPVGASYRSFRAVLTSPTTGYDFADFSIQPEGSDVIPLKFLFMWRLIDGDWKCDGYLYIRNETFFPHAD